jgi:FKBP-type peptidyl-prolyl cis-trans isomerase SlyD
MTIKPNTVVALTYDLHTNQNGEKTFVEQANEENPLVFLYGVGMMLPKFEENLAGLTSGATYDFGLLATDAYGDINADAVAELPLDLFGDMEKPEINSMIPLQDNEGNRLRARVVEVTDTLVIADLNHPMAGKDLHFTGTILNVREATADELAHGHAHGMHGVDTH